MNEMSVSNSFNLREELEDLLVEDLSDLNEQEDELEAWGLDSVRLMELVSRARQAGFEVTVADLMDNLTFSGIERVLGTVSGQEAERQ
jgi:hypothetical protein